MRSIVLCTLLAVCSGELTVGSAQSLATFKSSVEMVPISAVVRDRRGRIVTNLASGDFEVFDNGERRAIVDFQIDRSSPVSIAVLLDVSGSMRLGPKLAFASTVATQLAGALQEGRDEVGLFTFDAALHEQQPFTAHPAAMAAALTGARPFGTTSLYDAIAETARRLQARASPRRAIVVLTDGIDNSSRLTPPEVSAIASSIDVPVYVVVTVPPIDRQFDDELPAAQTTRASADLRDLAAWTGGDLSWATTAGEAAVSAREILTELRHEYLIAIPSATGQAWRPIEVRVRDRKMTVRARSGYFIRDASLQR